MNKKGLKNHGTKFPLIYHILIMFAFNFAHVTFYQQGLCAYLWNYTPLRVLLA